MKPLKWHKGRNQHTAPGAWPGWSYEIEKLGDTWTAWFYTERFHSLPPSTTRLVEGVSFTAARQACSQHHTHP